uniref:Uncharacterized protein n=1 Tax=Magallana gigas TaxID=29159 RepID=K1RCB9_MAGGI
MPLMDIFKLNLSTFYQSMEEILLAFNISVGSTDTVDVKQKVFDDFIDLSRHLQDVEEKVLTCKMKSRPGDQELKHLQERMKTHRGLFDYQEDVLTVEEINKRNIAKMIIRNVGHEGTPDKHGLRRLLQACIDFLQTKEGDLWKNASITIYDEDDNMYKIQSGNMKHQFICQMTDGEPSVDDKMSTSNYAVVLGLIPALLFVSK